MTSNRAKSMAGAAMRDIFFLVFLLAILFMAIKRPFLFVLAYCYVDIVAPQRLSFFLLNKVPLSLIMFGLAVLGWLIADNKKGMRGDQLQIVLALLLVYCGISTINADFPAEALEKWSWVWKALIWSMFLPLVLRTRLRIEALALTMVLSASALAITGGMKTALGGSGYGSLQLLLDDNSGLFEGSIFSTVAIAIIPLILWLARFGTIFKPSPYVWAFAIALVGACLLIPVGTQARTGLVCAAFLFILGLRDNKYRMRYIGGAAIVGLIALPLLPAAFAARMDTITNYQSDGPASRCGNGHGNMWPIIRWAAVSTCIARMSCRSARSSCAKVAGRSHGKSFPTPTRRGRSTTAISRCSVNRVSPGCCSGSTSTLSALSGWKASAAATRA